MKAKHFHLLLIALSLFSVGQTSPIVENKAKPDRIKIIETYKGNSYLFQVDPEYDYSAAYAGGAFELKITITTAAENKQNLNIIGCVPEGESSPIKIWGGGSTTKSEGGFLVNEFNYSLNIDPSADPRHYRINLRLQFPGEKYIDRFFNIKVYSKSNVKQSIVIRDEEPLKFYTGKSQLYRIKLNNNSSDYKIKVTKITVESNPPELIEYTDNAMVNGPVTLGPKEEESVELNIKVQKMSFTDLVSGFGENPRLKMTLVYFDDYGRKTTDNPPPRPVKIRTQGRVLIFFMVAGVLIGGLIRYLAENRGREEWIRGSELLKFGVYTVIFGMVVTVLALLGEIQIVAFKMSGSYDRPVAVFFIGLIGAVAGVQLLLAWINTFKPAEPSNGTSEGEAKLKTHKRRQKRHSSKNEPTEEVKEASEDEENK